MYFVFCGTLWYICVISFVLRIMICSQDLREIIIKNFTAINKECFKWDYNPFQKQPPKVFHKKTVHKNFAIFTGKNLCSLESLFNKVAGLKPCNFIQNRPQHSFSLWILRNFKLQTAISAFFKSILERAWKKSIQRNRYDTKNMKILSTLQKLWKEITAMCHYEFSSFSCTSLYYRHAQSSSYRVLNFKSVKKNRYEIYRDMNFILFLKHVNI